MQDLAAVQARLDPLFPGLMGVRLTALSPERVQAEMTVRPDLCTLHHTIHGGAIMAFADSVGAAATVINLPDDAKGTTTLESKTNFVGGAKEGTTLTATTTPAHRGRRFRRRLAGNNDGPCSIYSLEYK